MVCDPVPSLVLRSFSEAERGRVRVGVKYAIIPSTTNREPHEKFYRNSILPPRLQII